MARNNTQSISVDPKEKLLLQVLAKARWMKPAALARLLLYRGLHDFLRDGKVHPNEQEKKINEDLLTRIETDEELKQAKKTVLSETEHEETEGIKSTVHARKRSKRKQ